jgi:SAM-dependent methyltransferase
MLVQRIAGKIRTLSRRFPRRVECNVCGWWGRRFDSDPWHPYTVCWNCHSQIRHRLVVATWQRIEGLKYEDLVDGKRILHFAYEESTRPLLAPRAARYRTADFMAGNVDEKLDLSDMPSIAEGSVDLLIAADVLEHVPDHMRAMREIYRVLAPGGWAALTVPQKDNLETTHSDPSVTDPRERERLFGQYDHLRIFGNDMKQLLESVGFQVRVISAGDFPPDVVKRYVLFPPVLSPHPLATNYRRAYFAKKPVNE